MRRAVSLLETLVVVAIIGVVIGMSLPALQAVRAKANRTVCQNNLRQIALGVHMYHDVNKFLPYARACPAPWQGGRDVRCDLATPPTTFTGPGETWWCPYDNRPGSTPTAAAPGFTPAGFVTPFVENNTRVFRCPDATDRTPGSPTHGQVFQVSYAINPDVGGKKLGDVRGVLVFEHDDLPACRSLADHFTPWPASGADKTDRHEAKRHNGKANSAWYDGSIPSGF